MAVSQVYLRYATGIKMSKSNLIKGTAVLTVAGLLTRIIGFFYRVYLSNAMGAEKLGIYQLIFPIYGIAFTIFASGIQTAISKFVATELGRHHYKSINRTLKMGLILSVSIALVISFLTYQYADILAGNVLMEPRSADSLRILAFAFPFCGATACINGYYYGLKKAGVPAMTQLFEQLVRVLCVYFLATYLGNGDLRVTHEMAVFGIVIGEVASNLYNIFSLAISNAPKEMRHLMKTDRFQALGKRAITGNLLRFSAPLTANRLLISLLHSLEAILIPNLLRQSGLSNVEALSIYGILNGMAIPFIMFPSAITNSLSVLLLPTISEAQAADNISLIRKTTALSIKYSLLIGILGAGIFLSFGQSLGNVVFHNQLAGSLITTMAWLCPFLYITTTLSSIINGMGKAHLTFVNSIIGLVTRILLMLYLVPRSGINGYLNSLLISQLVITAFDGIIVIKNIRPPFHAIDWILKPGIIITLCSYILYRIYEYISPSHGGILILLGFCLGLTVLYLIFLGITKAVSLKDFK
jgi:stage V sporulation protein B